MKPLHWAAVCVLFWAAFIVFRLGTTVDITPGRIAIWALGLPLLFGFPALAGYNYAMWRCHHRVYSLRAEDVDKE